MSGGHFDYNQYRIGQIADDIDGEIRSNDSEELNEWGDRVGAHYSEATMEVMRDAIAILRRAEIYAQRIDWLLSGDDGEDCLHSRLAEDLQKLEEAQR